MSKVCWTRDEAETALPLDGRALSAAFRLGRVIEPPVCAAAGWGGHNRMWRLDTSTGTWAIKEVRRDLPATPERSFAIECAAVARGVPAPEPRASVDGNVYAHVDSAIVRCHRWLDGHAKTSETVTVADATAMSRIVAALHGLRIAVPTDPIRLSRRSFGEAHWVELAQRGAAIGAVWAEHVRNNAVWAEHVRNNIAAITAVESIIDRAAPRAIAWLPLRP